MCRTYKECLLKEEGLGGQFTDNIFSMQEVLVSNADTSKNKQKSNLKYTTTFKWTFLKGIQVDNKHIKNTFLMTMTNHWVDAKCNHDKIFLHSYSESYYLKRRQGSRYVAQWQTTYLSRVSTQILSFSIEKQLPPNKQTNKQNEHKHINRIESS